MYPTGPTPRNSQTEISMVIRTKQQKNYDRAVQLLTDLRAAAALHGRTERFTYYLTTLRTDHAN